MILHLWSEGFLSPLGGVANHCRARHRTNKKCMRLQFSWRICHQLKLLVQVHVLVLVLSTLETDYIWPPMQWFEKL